MPRTYYRAMVQGHEDSWNVRDRHMQQTLERLLAFHGPDAKAIVWAHNSHVGDARATDMQEHGLINLGQLARATFGADDVYVVGGSAYHGDVVASDAWGAPMRVLPVPPAPSTSWEGLLHAAGPDDRLLIFDDAMRRDLAWNAPHGHRAIGVVYDPWRERHNYVPTILPARYDALFHFEYAQAVEPLPVGAFAPDPDLPETYPTGE